MTFWIPLNPSESVNGLSTANVGQPNPFFTIYTGHQEIEYVRSSRSMAMFGAVLCLQVGKNFNPEADDFNLEGVFSLGLHKLAEFIGELSSNANKELGIEQVLVTAANIQFGFPSFEDLRLSETIPTPLHPPPVLDFLLLNP